MQVERHIEPDWTFPPSQGSFKGFVHHLDDVLRGGQHLGEFGDGADKTDDVGFLLAIGAKRNTGMARRFAQDVLTGNKETRDTVLPGSEDTSNGICRRATGGY